jgi:hypothetical protein
VVLAIPFALLLMNVIFNFIFGGVNVAFPIKLTVVQMGLSAATIFMGYGLSLRMNRKLLDQIPMAIALKRE